MIATKRKILSALTIAAFGNVRTGHVGFGFRQATAFTTTATTRRPRSFLASSYLDNLSNPSATPSPRSAASFTTSSPSSNFDYVPKLSLEQADTIANCAIQVCQRNGFNPVTVYVLDAGGSPLVSKRMDGCSPVGIPDFAKAKAYGCIVNQYPSRAFRDRYTTPPDDNPAKFCQMTTMVAISQNQMAPFPGGILLKVNDEHIVGAVGVSGAAGDEDEYCAIRGVMEANLGPELTTVPAQHSCSTVKDAF
jgi:glc operon protein GlcG